MPDKDAILRGIQSLPTIEGRGLEGNLTPSADIAWIGQDHGGKFWVTRELVFGIETVMLRTSGHPKQRVEIEEDFVKHLGKPTLRASELGVPIVDTTIWSANIIKSRLNKS